MARLVFYTDLVVGDAGIVSWHYHTESEEISMSDYLIETKKLTKVYGDQVAVKGVDLHVKKGCIYGLLGRNGAGKTTIMKMILGLTPITSGEVDVFGRNIRVVRSVFIPVSEPLSKLPVSILILLVQRTLKFLQNCVVLLAQMQ